MAANQYIRDAFRRELNGVDFFFPKNPERCTDNGAMVAVAGLKNTGSGVRDFH
ncbi:MAG: hypothetical protein Ct9H300mP3_04360 [Gammaproteobacteria bacterium]|nr:MAG: hypothetical protein Ct9H300mP3_04360 [Gammaproteobacteria bacterium]